MFGENFDTVLGTAILVAVIVLLVFGIVIAIMIFCLLRRANRAMDNLEKVAANLGSASEFFKSWPMSAGRVLKSLTRYIPKLNKNQED